MSFSWWFGEIIITGQLWRGRRQCHQYPECICTAAAAEGKTLIVRETVQTLEVEKEENQRQVPGSFQRYDANVCPLLMLKIEHGFSSSTLATSCGKISVASSLSLQSYLLVVFVVWHHQVVVIKIITLLLIIHQQPLASLLYSTLLRLWCYGIHDDGSATSPAPPRQNRLVMGTFSSGSSQTTGFMNIWFTTSNSGQLWMISREPSMLLTDLQTCWCEVPGTQVDLIQVPRPSSSLSYSQNVVIVLNQQEEHHEVVERLSSFKS